MPTRRLGLSGSTLKLLACLLMLVDHIGLLLCPTLPILRLIGRLSFPIFAFFIAEGCRHTRHKTRRLLWLLVPGLVMLLAYYLYDGTLQGSIFLTFAGAAALIFLLDAAVERHSVVAAVGFVAALAGLWLLCGIIPVDYGFYGMLTPVFVRVADHLTRRDSLTIRLAGLGVGLTLLTLEMGAWQSLSLIALIPLALYNGQRGRYPLKYFFYAFYPLHLVILQLLATLIKRY